MSITSNSHEWQITLSCLSLYEGLKALEGRLMREKEKERELLTTRDGERDAMYLATRSPYIGNTRCIE